MLRTLLAMSRLALSTPFLVAATPDPGSPSFCARLAPKLRMKPAGPRASPPTAWKVDVLGGLGPALFGGSATVFFSVEPIDGEENPDPAIFRDACKANPKGATCTLKGPAELHVGTKNGEVTERLRAGEQPIVEMRGTSIHCRDS